MSINIRKRSGKLEPLDIRKIQKQTIEATEGLDGVGQSTLEVDAQIKFAGNVIFQQPPSDYPL